MRWWGEEGDTRMCKYDVISSVQVHLLIAHLNSFHLLWEMNGVINCIAIHCTQKMKGIKMGYQ